MREFPLDGLTPSSRGKVFLNNEWHFEARIGMNLIVH